MKNLLFAFLLLPVTVLACDGNEQNNVNFYQALFDSESANIDDDLKHDASEALTESMMKNISCSPIKDVKENSILPESLLISIEYSNLNY